jgi:hypothetical protein
MPVVGLSASEWFAIFTHVKKWVRNLSRAKNERKEESKEALRAVIKAVRETRLYLRDLREGGKKSIEKERELSMLWTNLSFDLKDLSLKKLADRCNSLGSYWADPDDFDEAFLDRAGNRLPDIEELAEASLKDLEKHQGSVVGPS